MESAQFAIESDDVFYLTKLPILNGLLEPGLTLFVDKEFPPFHDMTLTQYAIAKRKPNCLEALLRILKEDLKQSYTNIIFPRTSNTRMDLFKLAIKFGSVNDYYQTPDNKCLDKLIEFRNTCQNASNVNNDNDNNNNNNNNTNEDSEEISQSIQRALIEAIEAENPDAIKTLIENGASLLHPLSDEVPENIRSSYPEQKEQIDPSNTSKMAIISIFKMYNDQDKLSDIFSGVLKDYSSAIFERLMYTNIIDFFSPEHDTSARNYLVSMLEKAEEEIGTHGDVGGSASRGSERTATQSSITCCHPGCHKRGNECGSCGKYYCEKHIIGHTCNHE